MATKVLSIEIGQGLTRVVEMDYKVKNPKVYNYFTFETPSNAPKNVAKREIVPTISVVSNPYNSPSPVIKAIVGATATNKIHFKMS